MSNKVKRKVTVETHKDSGDQPRRPSVFERLGKGSASSIPLQSQNRSDLVEKCRDYQRFGFCKRGEACKYQHDPPIFERPKPEKNMDEKDLRHRVRTKRDTKESRTGSISPKRKSGKRSNSHSRKGDHESKIKSTVVVTRPRSPPALGAPTGPSSAPPHQEATESRKKPDGSWEDDSDDWPMDAAQLDYKEELTLERKRQQLQRELELELQKEQLMNENVTVTKNQVSFSESSSSSSSSESGSRSTSSDSSSSSSEEDSDASSSSSSSTSSSGSRTAATTKRRTKHNQQTTNKEQARKRSLDAKSSRESYDKIKSGRSSKSTTRGRSPSPTQHEARSGKKSRDRRGLLTPSPKRHGQQELKVPSAGKTVSKVRGRGPRTPSPPPPPTRNKQRQWGQSSSTDSRVESRRGRGKKHRRKRDLPRNNRLKPGQPPAPPRLSSPNRTALLPMPIVKKSKQRREERERNRRRGRNSSPLLLSRIGESANAQQPKLLGYAQQYPASNLDKSGSKHGHSSDRSKHSRKESGEISSRTKQGESRDKSSRRKSSPRKEPKGSASPHRFENDHLMGVARKVHTQASSHPEKDAKGNRHRSPVSPPRTVDNSRERRSKTEPEKRRDAATPPRDYAMHRDGPFHGGDVFEKGNKAKRGLSPEGKKGREERNRERSQKDRVSDYDSSGAWNEDHRKSIGAPGGRRTPEPHGRVEMRAQQPGVPPRGERSREKDPDRKKRKDRDVSLRSSMEDIERPARMPSPRRGSQSPLLAHLPQREIESLTGTRSRMYESDLPPPEHEYAYGYETLRDPYMDRLLPPEYEQDVLRGPPLYPPDVYADSRYRRDPSLKDGAPPMMDRYGGRDGLSPRDMIPHRDVIGMPGRNDDYISDLSMDERRSFDERWSRTRVGSRADEWDPYVGIAPAPLPPHVAAGLDEDRYGMPRRRRASPPDWPRNRAEERDILPPVTAVHRPGRGSLPAKEGRSRSPAKGPGANRGSWNNERGNRQEANRNSDNRHDDAQKNQEDRKSRNAKKDRGKRKDDPAVADKPKEKHGGTKRPHSSSPVPTKDAKRRKEDVQVPDGTATTEKATVSTKRNRDDARSETKSSGRSQKSTKLDGASPTSDLSHSSRVSGQEKSDAPPKISVETKTKVDIKDDKKSRRNNDSKAIADDDFSDWSDDADELLNRDDFAESEITTENLKSRNEKSKEDAGSSKQKENQRPAKDYVQDLKNKVKERGSSSRTSSKERTHDVSSHSSKEKDKISVEVKDIEMQETYLLKDENATDVEEYITAESVDYDPISDEELDALIEEPDDSLLKPSQDKEKSKIVDALDINWSTLMAEKKTEFVPGFARQRFKAAHILSRIGFSQVFAGAELSEKLIGICQKQLDEENRQKGEGEAENSVPGENVFTMEHPIASFHVAISQNKVERKNAFNRIGPFRRALCARRDLQIRKLLCKPVNKLTACAPVVYSPQYSVVDKDLYKQSLELLRQKKAGMLPPAVDAC